MILLFSGKRCVSKRRSAVSTSSAASASTSAAASSAALETPAATCGRATKAASPIIATRPKASCTLQVVNRLKDRLVDEPDDCAELRRQQPFRRCTHRRDVLSANKRRRDRNRMADTAAISEELRQLRSLIHWPIPNHIVSPLALSQLVVRPGDGIAEALLPRRQAERHRHKEFGVDGWRNHHLGQ